MVHHALPRIAHGHHDHEVGHGGHQRQPRSRLLPRKGEEAGREQSGAGEIDRPYVAARLADQPVEENVARIARRGDFRQRQVAGPHQVAEVIEPVGAHLVAQPDQQREQHDRQQEECAFASPCQLAQWLLEQACKGWYAEKHPIGQH